MQWRIHHQPCQPRLHALGEGVLHIRVLQEDRLPVFRGKLKEQGGKRRKKLLMKAKTIKRNRKTTMMIRANPPRKNVRIHQ